MKELIVDFQKNIMGGIKVPHGISQPVIHFENGKYYLAFFVFFYTRVALEKGEIDRPTMWLIADIDTLEIINEYQTTEKEFSNASYNVKYSVRSDANYDTSKDYYDQAYRILNSVRAKIIKDGKLDTEEYQHYLDRIMANIPKEYCRFYRDLSV